MPESAIKIRDLKPEQLPVYPPYRAGALAGVSGYRIGQWARYGLITPSFYKGRPTNLYAFLDVAEAIVVHWLLDHRFTYDDIHAAIDGVRQDYPDWPLLYAPLGIAQHAVEGDDRGAIVHEVDRDVYVDAGRGGDQVTLRPQLHERARDMLRRGGWIAEELGLRRIEVDPGKLGGLPTVQGRRWPIERVAQLAADDVGRTILIADYGLDDRDIAESVRWVAAAAQL
jgi:uncharacterized protein (DUF433 family)